MLELKDIHDLIDMHDRERTASLIRAPHVTQVTWADAFVLNVPADAWIEVGKPPGRTRPFYARQVQVLERLGYVVVRTADHQRLIVWRAS